MTPRNLLSGIDTAEAAYYMAPSFGGSFDYAQLLALREELRSAKVRRPKAVMLGNEEFLLQPNGTSSGYPLLLENDWVSVQTGEFNKPNFFVTFRSFALWHVGLQSLHRRFLSWAASVGLVPYQSERLSRVDFTFDYALPALDFDEDNFVSQAVKDTQFRKNGKVQTFKYGEGDVVLRQYNKVDEINEKSHKTWFFTLWGQDKDVWRTEWQVRKPWLRRFGIRSVDDLMERQGDLLRVLVHDHTTLRIKTADSNRARWPLHPLWADLQARVNAMPGLGIVREIDPEAQLLEREMRLAISVYGYLKRLGAIQCVKQRHPKIRFEDALAVLGKKLTRVHDELTWENDVHRRYDEIRLAQW